MKASEGKKRRWAAMLGVGLDDDGHRRITRGENFLLLGGSEETHGRMQETALRINEQLENRGKRLEDASPEEIREIVADLDD
jgi:hypothetical protein